MKKLINYFKELELYQIFVVIFLGFAVFMLVTFPFIIYKESITHYDIAVTYANGEEEVFHCRSYQQKDGYLYYNVDGNSYYINLELVVLWNIQSSECYCNSV